MTSPSTTTRPSGKADMAPEQRARWRVPTAAAIAQAALWAGAIDRGGTFAVVTAIALQLGTVLPIVQSLPRRRGLAAALSLTVPVVGPIAATLAASVSGHRARELLRGPQPEPRRIDGHEIVNALVDAVPACEAVLSPNAEVRRSCLARLARRANASDIAILRWARAQSSGDIAVEIALALEDVVARFESRAADARRAAAVSPGYDAHAHAFRVLVAGICNGAVDEPAVESLAKEARHHHEAARAADGDRARELLADRARLELAVDQPGQVIEMLAPFAGDGELAPLFEQAAYAARRFELAPELYTRRSRARDRA